MINDNPILNNPYQEPQRHYATSLNGELDYAQVRKGRRIFDPHTLGQSMPVRQQKTNLFEVNDYAQQYQTHLINLVRREVGAWRTAQYPQTTRVTKELLTFWFLDAQRVGEKQLFFAQQEAIETAIWLTEVAAKSNPGHNILRLLEEARKQEDSQAGLPRMAFKMATGTGKTVVMAALILYHFFNRQAYRQDTRFADYFLLIAPGITIKERLGVLYVDTLHKKISGQIQDYYRLRYLVPRHYDQTLESLNARLVITNYHNFELRALQGNKRSPFDGKLDKTGRKVEAKEDRAQMMKRVLGKFRKDTRLLILNDEAHHCYLPKQAGRNTEEENSKTENDRAAVWFTGLREIAQRFKVQAVYDLSATPYYLSGSGYEPYTLFPWVVTDFGLIEAIESGLVKIPFLPETDDTQQLETPVLRNLYEHVKTHLPRKGQQKRRKEAEAKDQNVDELAPNIPELVKNALDQFYGHYEKEFKSIRGLLDSPPVLIVVCNNTSVSKEIYKHLAGYEKTSADGNVTEVIPGQYELFSNFHSTTRQALPRPRTLLIDSDALENADHINEEFKQVFAVELERFKQEYRLRHPEKSVDNITEAEILREVVNTVGKKGLLGAEVRCVVSVSMLTEGWDSQTVTHIMGLRAFGSQLLCEQVAGRALRRKNYVLGQFTIPDERGKLIKIDTFAPEYAYIIGVPFKLFKVGTGVETYIPDHETHAVYALPNRQAHYEITFPSVIGYRIETSAEELTADFSQVENFIIDGSRFPTETVLQSAFSAQEEKLTLVAVLEKRDQEIIYHLTRYLLKFYYCDDDGNPKFYQFHALKKIVSEWYATKIHLLGITKPDHQKLVYFSDVKAVCDSIMKGIRAANRDSSRVLPVLNYYNPLGSSQHVHGSTTRLVYPTVKSHVNLVVADTDNWEQIAAKTLEEIEEVEAYVKNAYLGFAIPYVSAGKDRWYYPDFIARCRRKDTGEVKNLVIEITGMNQDKAEKRWTMENYWLPAVNTIRAKYQMEKWEFIDIANDIRDIKNRLVEKIYQ